MFAVVVMSVVVLGAVAQKLNKYRNSLSVCVCFSEDTPQGTFSPGGVFYLFLKIPPVTFELPPG